MEKTALSVILADNFKEFDLLGSTELSIQNEYLKNVYHDFTIALTYINGAELPDGLRLRNGFNALMEVINLFDKLSKEIEKQENK